MNSLPPRRALPDDVRERLRTRVLGDQPGRTRSPGVLAAAAAVVLVVGGLSLSSSVDRTQPTTDTPTTLPPPGVVVPLWGDDELDRCWAALVDAGKTDGYPDRSDWRVAVSDENGNVTAAWAGDKPIVCATTASHVTVSSPTATPTYLGGSRTGVLLSTETGVVAGVVDPEWAAVEFVQYFPTSGVNRAAQAGGLFVYTTPENPIDPRMGLQLRRAEDPSSPDHAVASFAAGPGPTPVTVYDRPGEPGAGDQDALNRCLQAAGVPDVESWSVGADWLGRVNGQIRGGGGTLGRDGDRVVVCDRNLAPGPEAVIDLGTVPVPAADAPPVRLRAHLSYPAIMGLVSADAAYVDVHFGDLSLRTSVVNSTFAVEDVGGPVSVEVFDRDHNSLYSGPLPQGDS